jgi:hypothetical protein
MLINKMDTFMYSIILIKNVKNENQKNKELVPFHNMVNTT